MYLSTEDSGILVPLLFLVVCFFPLSLFFVFLSFTLSSNIQIFLFLPSGTARVCHHARVLIFFLVRIPVSGFLSCFVYIFRDETSLLPFQET